ncbi:hypothetical protein CHS0354_042071, partial [Potamilus streckersoni]
MRLEGTTQICDSDTKKLFLQCEVCQQNSLKQFSVHVCELECNRGILGLFHQVKKEARPDGTEGCSDHTR